MYCRHRQDIGAAMDRVPAVPPRRRTANGSALTGRGWGLVERYRCEDADLVIATMGSMCGTAREAVDALREAGAGGGLLKLRLFRPLPRGRAARSARRRARRAGARPQLLARRRRRAASGAARGALRHGARAAPARLSRRRGRRQRTAGKNRRARRARARAARPKAEPVWADDCEKLELPAKSILCSGHAACPGCIDALSVRHVLAALGPDTVAVIPPSCMAIIAGAQPLSGMRIPVYQPTPRIERRRGLGPAPRARCARAAGYAGRGARGRRRHLRHRLPVPVLGRRAQREHPLRLLRQRGLHEHRRAEVLVHAALRAHRLDARGQAHAARRTSSRSWPRTRFRTPPPPPRASCRTSCARSRRRNRCAARGCSRCSSRAWTAGACPKTRASHVARLAVESGVFPLYEVEDGAATR